MQVPWLWRRSRARGKESKERNGVNDARSKREGFSRARALMEEFGKENVDTRGEKGAPLLKEESLA